MLVVTETDMTISIWQDTLSNHRHEKACKDLGFYRWDGGDAYTQVSIQKDTRYTVPGILYINQADKNVDPSKMVSDRQQVVVIANRQQDCCSEKKDQPDSEGKWDVQGFVFEDKRWQQREVAIIPVRQELFSRARGILGTEILSDSCVLVAGLSSVGSFVTEQLAMNGIMNYILWDFDKVELGNLCRGRFEISDIGRYKVKVAEWGIKSKNPYAKVVICKQKITWQTKDFLAEDIQRSDLVIGSVDNRHARLILCHLCVMYNKPLILMGARHMAFGLEILFTRRPKKDPCYVDFLMSLPVKDDFSILSNLQESIRHPYTDRPVDKIEPGLSVDIAPMNIMVTKLCLNYLLKDKQTTLKSMDEDLSAPLYRYLNRREVGTKYEKLEPLAFNAGNGKMHILSWQGIDLKRNPGCPVCGDYINIASKAAGISVSKEEIGRYQTK
jgi:molybdopterin/thiamine biosynthesis adenylyltransferase